MKRRSLKGQLAKRLFEVSDHPALTDMELLLLAVSSLIHSTEQLHGKLRYPETARIADLEAALDECCEDWRTTEWAEHTAMYRAQLGLAESSEGDEHEHG